MRARPMRGGSLLETMVALMLVALAALATSSTQLATMRAGQDAGARHRALWLADSLAEAERCGVQAEIDWPSAAALLADGTLTSQPNTAEIREAVVRWRAAQLVPGAPAACEASVSGTTCVRLAFRAWGEP